MKRSMLLDFLMVSFIITGVVLISLLVVQAFDADLDTPITKPSVTNKSVNALQFLYNKQRVGNALAKIDVICDMNYWTTDDAIVETVKVLDMNGTVFFAGNTSVALI